LTSLSSLKLTGFRFIVLLQKVENFFSEVMEQQNINFLINCDENIQIVADEKMLEQVMINLVKNALEALKDSKDPQIETSCYQEDDSLLISVSDNGEGIPQDKLEQVFIPFFTTRIDGSGIGLSLCKQIIQMHDGQIDIQSEKGKGSTVSIRLRIS
jgi:signal transduction histidine kinase